MVRHGNLWLLWWLLVSHPAMSIMTVDIINNSLHTRFTKHSVATPLKHRWLHVTANSAGELPRATDRTTSTPSNQYWATFLQSIPLFFFQSSFHQTLIHRTHKSQDWGWQTNTALSSFYHPFFSIHEATGVGLWHWSILEHLTMRRLEPLWKLMQLNMMRHRCINVFG